MYRIYNTDSNSVSMKCPEHLSWELCSPITPSIPYCSTE